MYDAEARNVEHRLFTDWLKNDGIHLPGYVWSVKITAEQVPSNDYCTRCTAEVDNQAYIE